MNQQTRGDKNKFEHDTWKINKTDDVLTELERKMYSHFNKKNNQQHLLNSNNEQFESKGDQQTKGKSAFKLFTKINPKPMNIEQLQKETPSKIKSKQFIQDKKKTQMGQLIQEVEAIQILVRKKLALKEERVAQLERQISIQTEEKIHLYRINCQLQQQLSQLAHNRRVQQSREVQQQKLLEQQLKRLNRIYEQKKNQGKKLKKQQDLLRQTIKNSHNHRKGYIESQIRSKSKQVLNKKQDKHQQKYLRDLVIELDRLKNMVKQKMKKSKSKNKIKIK